MRMMRKNEKWKTNDRRKATEKKKKFNENRADSTTAAKEKRE